MPLAPSVCQISGDKTAYSHLIRYTAEEYAEMAHAARARSLSRGDEFETNRVPDERSSTFEA